MRKAFVRFTSLAKRVSLGILLAGVVIVSARQAGADPPTSVTCGDTITAPGQYFLAGNCTGAGIEINASDVDLKLMGHTMTGMGLPFGIGAFDVSHVQIQGPGTITGYGRGIFFSGVSDSHVEQVSAIDNGIGLDLFSISNHNHLNNNVASGNSSVGIFVRSGSTFNHINGNTALLNSADFIDTNSDCDNNKWNGNTFGSASPCIH